MLKNDPGTGPAVLGHPEVPRDPPKQAKNGPKMGPFWGPKMTPKMGSFLGAKMSPKIRVSIVTQKWVDPDLESPPTLS